MIFPNLYFYYEVYNLTKTEPNTFTKAYQIINSTGGVVKSVTGGVGKKDAEMSGRVGRIGISDLPEGAYKLKVTVTDNASKQLTQREHDFSIKYYNQKFLSTITDDMIRRASGDDLDNYLRGVKYIADRDEVKKLNKLKNDAEKRKFLLSFWEARSKENNMKHHQLVELANKEYGTFNKQGWETDRGRVIIKYGNPDEVETHTMEVDSPEYTIWRYYALRGYFIFAETRIHGDLMLVDSNVPGEIYDPEWKTHTDDLIKGQKSLDEGDGDF